MDGYIYGFVDGCVMNWIKVIKYRAYGVIIARKESAIAKKPTGWRPLCKMACLMTVTQYDYDSCATVIFWGQFWVSIVFPDNLFATVMSGPVEWWVPWFVGAFFQSVYCILTSCMQIHIISAQRPDILSMTGPQRKNTQKHDWLRKSFNTCIMDLDKAIILMDTTVPICSHIMTWQTYNDPINQPCHYDYITISWVLYLYTIVLRPISLTTILRNSKSMEIRCKSISG